LVSVVDSTGRFIKVFDTLNSSCLYSFKRGIKHCTVANACFSLSGEYLAVSSSTNTIHVFQLEANSLGVSMQVDKNSFKSKGGLNLIDNFKSYFTDVLSLTTSSMRLHLSEKMGCSWVAKEGTMSGPMVVFNKKNKLVIST
jgi:hypothetical protein